MAFNGDHLMQVAPMRLRERKLFMSTPDDHPIRIARGITKSARSA
jgi:hypothetical protein